MRWYHWIAVALVAAMTVVAYLLGRRNGDDNLADTIRGEVDLIETRAEVRRLIAERDASHARAWVEDRYHDRIAQLDAEGKATVVRLRDDPVALTDWLARIGRRP